MYRVSQLIQLGQHYKLPSTLRRRTTIKMTCSVCLHTLGNGNPVVLTDCAHLLHEACLTEWPRRSPKSPNCLKPRIKLIKVFTTIDFNNDIDNPTESVESCQAYLEIKNENAGLKSQLNTAEAIIQR